MGDPILAMSRDSEVVSEGINMDGRSFWLDSRLCNADKELPGDLAALSASSFLKASSSRSNFRPKTSI